LLCRLEENICFKCAKEIVTVDELSIEHKEPWEGRSAELFWDLNNIAFSHLRCNTIHRVKIGEYNTAKRKIGPEGTAWCIGCQKFESIENFYKSPTRWNGLQGYCKLTMPDRPRGFTGRTRKVSVDSTGCSEDL
jgi:hypothetical protein